MKANRLSWLLVGMQVALMTAMALPATRPYWSLTGALLMTAGLALGVWSFVVMGRHLRIMPEPAAEASLLRHGPYRLIRHPMYAALVLGAGGWLLCTFSWPRLVCLLVLLPVLALKAAREERLLAEKFPGYAAYRAASRRFVPWVW